jgi:hypothetical protein
MVPGCADWHGMDFSKIRKPRCDHGDGDKCTVLLIDYSVCRITKMSSIFLDIFFRTISLQVVSINQSPLGLHSLHAARGISEPTLTFFGGTQTTCTPLTALSSLSEACIEKAVAGANILVFVIPHQFIGGLCEKICKNVAPDCIGVSLIKGLDFDDKGLVLISDIISDRLGEMSMSKARMSDTRHRNRVIFAPATVWKWNPPGRQRLACIEEGRATCALPKILVFVHREVISELCAVNMHASLG